jgi:hypothetical protein
MVPLGLRVGEPPQPSAVWKIHFSDLSVVLIAYKPGVATSSKLVPMYSVCMSELMAGDE